MTAGKHSSAKYLAVLAHAGFCCRYCGFEADTVDHIVPRERGGSDDEKNLIAACRRCNAVKGTTRLPADREQELLAEAFMRAEEVRRLAAEIKAQRHSASQRRKTLGGFVELPTVA